MCQKEEEKSVSELDAKKLTTDASQTLAATKHSRPDNPVLIFDGDCGFCTVSAKRVKSLVSNLSILAWQSVQLADYGLTESQVTERAYLFEPGADTPKGGSDAIFGALAIADNKLIRFLAKLWLYPPLVWVGRLTYPVLARNRHKLPGATDACRID